MMVLIIVCMLIWILLYLTAITCLIIGAAVAIYLGVIAMLAAPRTMTIISIRPAFRIMDYPVVLTLPTVTIRVLVLRALTKVFAKMSLMFVVVLVPYLLAILHIASLTRWSPQASRQSYIFTVTAGYLYRAHVTAT